MSDDTPPRNDSGGADGTTPPRRRSLLFRAAKWLLLSVAAILLLVIAVIGVAVAYLSPDRLTPMVNKYASEYLIADVEAARVELSLWSTFPRLEIRVDSLRIDSRALDGLADSRLAELPVDAARLLEVEQFHGSVNVPAILNGQVRLHDVVIHNPKINLVAVNDSVANYLIVPPSDADGSIAVV
ncbi:MAG: AsmA family protein, partial [Candidatus Amulumruptor sp.]|nr:AsmA family protein [Candidatus Amulumruptor sp.]